MLSTASIASPLKNHPSAYIALHADDPINWHLWNAETLQTARQQNKLILISSGYFACHWCHVMHQENYQDPMVAELLNRHFISVKIDRELLPDLDDYLLNLARRATGQAGWPLHVILTPEGYGFSAFVYQPRDTLLNTLNQLQSWWQTDAETIRQLAQPPQQAIADSHNPTQILADINQRFADLIDSFEGGLNATQKFPHSPFLKHWLLRPQLDQQTAEWLIFTLEQMQSEHLYDHVHHGFFRYTVDPNWQEPHFEKMLYDNAQLAEIYLLAAERFDRPDFLATAEQTLAYIERELMSPITGLASASQSAIDQQGVDGGRYLWSRDAIRQHLSSAEFDLVNQAWSLEQAPPFDAGWLPKPIDHQAWLSIQSKLAQRPSLTDDKQLLSWNGLLLSAYARAYGLTANPNYALQAHSLSHRLIQLLQLDPAPRAVSDQSLTFGNATLEDYAFVLAGLRLWQSTANLDLSATIQQLVQTAEQKFKTPNGWIASIESLLPGQQTPTSLPDLATPSASAILECGQTTEIQIAAGLQAWQYASYLTYQTCD